MIVDFEALIKEIKIKSLVSLDKEARVTLQFDGSNTELLNKLNQLHRADELVKVKIGKQ